MSNKSSILGPELTYNSDDNTLVRSAAFGAGSHHGGGGSGGTTPSATLVTSAGSNLEFNLIWDSSVANLGSNETAFINAMVNVSKYYETLFTTSHTEVINIKVGWGEVNGQSLPGGAIGASETNGYLTNYSAVTNGLIASSGGVTTSASFNANEPTGAQFFISSAEAKGFGLINPTSTGVDGYVGFGTLSGTGYSWNFTSSATTGQGSGTGPLQFDFQGVAQHEISEVMGRIEMEGHTTFNGLATYTPLDLFNFDSSGHLVLSGGDNATNQVNSYFSINSGATPHGYFNDGYKSGDIADWASYLSDMQSQTLTNGYQDAFDAFAYPSVNTDLSYSDQLVMETLGVSSTGLAIA
jgi:hypothetical protein